MPKYTHEQLFTFSERIIASLGSSREAAAVVAEHLASANLAGHDSHGVLRLPQYRNHVREGKIDPAAEPEVVRETSTTALMNGSSAWGQVVAKRAMDIALEKASQHALSAVSIRNCYHIGRVGVYPLQAAREGYIAQVYCNGHGVARIAPWGSTEAKLATNPVAIAVPTRDAPILVDITTSVVAEGKVRVAKNAGKAIPEGWILDKDGQPTTDPEDLYAGGTILPFGGPQGHKGYGMSVVVDLLGGVLSDAGCGFMTEKFGNGVFMQVVDPRAFEDEDTFLDRVDAYAKYLKSAAPRPGVEEVLLPGEPELRTEAKRRRDGIEIDEGTLKQLGELADELGVGALG